jgi:hypothetical protein
VECPGQDTTDDYPDPAHRYNPCGPRSCYAPVPNHDVLRDVTTAVIKARWDHSFHGDVQSSTAQCLTSGFNNSSLVFSVSCPEKHCVVHY